MKNTERMRQWRKENPEKVRAWSKRYKAANKAKLRLTAANRELRTRYGLSLASKMVMAAAQGNMCAICDGPGPLHVDHCHTTGVIRALLCHGCNKALGFMKDDPRLLERAARYLREHRY